MEQRLSLITLGVRDLAKSTAYFEALGWKRSVKDASGVSFFQCGGIALALFPRIDLASDAGIAAAGSGFAGFSIAHNTRSKQEVDQLLIKVRSLGAEIVKTAADTVWGGYVGYFKDLDGHLWEIAWNPAFAITPDGAVILPE